MARSEPQSAMRSPLDTVFGTVARGEDHLRSDLDIGLVAAWAEVVLAK
ncbi:hypothetical protein G9X68_02810 [Rhizobium sp. WYCCWR 11279]|nr:hypothetical protein [Rhizobium changzhiense]NNU46064.1 hypothetical protein [Rhizobium changzhiense]